MLHPQNYSDNSFDAVFSRIMGQPGGVYDYAEPAEAAPEAAAVAEEAASGPGIFDKWRSALVDSLDHGSDTTNMQLAHDHGHGHNNGHEIGYDHSYQQHRQIQAMPYALDDGIDAEPAQPQWQIQEEVQMLPKPAQAEKLLPLSRQSSRPVSPTRQGQWVKVGSQDPSAVTASSHTISAKATTQEIPRMAQQPHTSAKQEDDSVDTEDEPEMRPIRMRKSASQSSLSALTSKAASAHSMRGSQYDAASSDGAGPGGLTSGLRRPGSAGSLSRSRLSKMGSPAPDEILQAAGKPTQQPAEKLMQQPAMKPVEDIGLNASDAPNPPGQSRRLFNGAHEDSPDQEQRQNATGFGRSISSDIRVGPAVMTNGAAAAAAAAGMRETDEAGVGRVGNGGVEQQASRSMAASLEDMLSKVPLFISIPWISDPGCILHLLIIIIIHIFIFFSAPMSGILHLRLRLRLCLRLLSCLRLHLSHFVLILIPTLHFVS